MKHSEPCLQNYFWNHLIICLAIPMTGLHDHINGLFVDWTCRKLIEKLKAGKRSQGEWSVYRAHHAACDVNVCISLVRICAQESPCGLNRWRVASGASKTTKLDCIVTTASNNFQTDKRIGSGRGYFFGGDVCSRCWWRGGSFCGGL